MFSGIGSLGNLNSTFASFTNALSLDNLQPQTENEGGSKVEEKEENSKKVQPLTVSSSLSAPTALPPPAAPSTTSSTSGLSESSKSVQELLSKGHSRIFYEQKILEFHNIIETQKEENQILKDRYKEIEQELTYIQSQQLQSHVEKVVSPIPTASKQDDTLEIETLKQVIDTLRDENRLLKQEKQQFSQKSKQFTKDKEELETKIRQIEQQLLEQQQQQTREPTSPFTSPEKSSSILSPTHAKSFEEGEGGKNESQTADQLRQLQEENKKLLNRIKKWKTIESEMQEKIKSLQQSNVDLQSQLKEQSVQHESSLQQQQNGYEAKSKELQSIHEKQFAEHSQATEEKWKIEKEQIVQHFKNQLEQHSANVQLSSEEEQKAFELKIKSLQSSYEKQLLELSENWKTEKEHMIRENDKQLRRQQDDHELKLTEKQANFEETIKSLQLSFDEKLENLRTSSNINNNWEIEKEQLLQLHRLEISSALQEKEKLFQEQQAVVQHQLTLAETEYKQSLQQNEKFIEQLQSTVSQQANQILAAQEKYQILEERFHRLQGEINNTGELTKQLELREQQEKQSLQAELMKKEELVKNVESKVAGMTEKFKELMQKYADLKNKNSSLEKAVETISAEREKALQQKESDIVKINLKMERVEQLNIDLKSDLQSLSDKYSENQRYVQDLKQQYHDFAAQHSQCDSLIEKIQLLEREKDDLITSYERKILILQRDTQENQEKLQSQISSLQYSYELLEKKYSDDTENKQLLDNYKKKAQAALKKSNDLVTKLTSEKELLERSNQELQADLEQIQSELKAVTEVKVNLEKTLYDEREKWLQVESELHEKYSSMVEQLQNQIQTQKSLSSRVGGTASGIVSKSGKAPPPAPVTDHTQSDQYLHIDDELDENGVAVDSDDSGGRDHGENRSNTDSYTEISYPNISEVNSQNLNYSSPVPHKVLSEIGDSNEDLLHMNDKYLFVKQLQDQLLEMRNHLARSNAVIEELSHNLKLEKNEKNELKGKYEDLLAYINRLNRYQSSAVQPVSPAASGSSLANLADSTIGAYMATSNTVSEKSAGSVASSSMHERNINYEYLKNCIYKYMTSNNLSEKQRLYPVIGMILQFTSKELKQIEGIIQEEIQSDPTDQIQTAITTISSSFDYWFSGNPSNAEGRK